MVKYEGTPQAIPIYQLDEIEQGALLDWSRPFVIDTKHPACSRSPADELAAFENGTYIPVSDSHFVMTYDKLTDRYAEEDLEVNAAQFADMVRSGKAQDHDIYWAYYMATSEASNSKLGQSAAACAFHEIEAQLGLRQHEISGKGSRLSMWAGPAGHVEYLHYDDEANLHLVVCGKKRWLLFPPNQVCKLNFVTLWEAVYNKVMQKPPPLMGPPHRGMRGGPSTARGFDHHANSRHYFCGEGKDRNHPDHWSRSDGVEVVLNPGMAMYLPAGWPHEVTGEEWKASPDDSAANIEDHAQSFVLSINKFYSTPLVHSSYLTCCCKSRRLSRMSLAHSFYAWWAVFRLRFYNAIFASY